MSYWSFLLDLLLPQKPLVRALLAMTPDEFAARAPRSMGRAGDVVISLFAYGDPLVREAVWMLKYRGNRTVAALLAAVLYDELLGFLEEYAPLTGFTDPLVIPIPLSRKRERERGFNQCVLLCAELMRLDSPFVKGSGESPSRRISSSPLQRGGLRWGANANTKGRTFSLSLSALRKIKDTPSQTKMDKRTERLKNLAGCFLADPKEVEGRNIILIDDVATTGATLEEARRALRHAGARKVIAFTIAH